MLAPAAALQRLHRAERRQRMVEIEVEREGGRQHRDRVQREMLARRRHAIAQLLAADLRRHIVAVRQDLAIGQPRPRAVLGAEGQDPRAHALGLGLQAVEVRIVERQDGRAAGHQAVEDLGLGVGDLRHRGEELDMHRLDRGDDGDVRPHHLRQRRDLAGMVHAELEHAIAGVARHARQAERRAPLVVEVAGGGEGRREQRQHRAQRFLGAGLADAAGDGGDLGIGPAAGGAAQVLQRLHGVDHFDHRRAGGQIVRAAMDQRAGGAALQGGGGEIVPVEGRALQRHEQVALLEAARIDRDAGHGEVARTLPGDGGGDLGGGPERAHRTSLTGAPPSSAAIWRATSASSNG